MGSSTSPEALVKAGEGGGGLEQVDVVTATVGAVVSFDIVRGSRNRWTARVEADGDL